MTQPKTGRTTRWHSGLPITDPWPHSQRVPKAHPWRKLPACAPRDDNGRYKGVQKALGSPVKSRKPVG